MRKNTSGFTVVELIVIIVVIAILASITIVSYAQVTKNARTAQTTSAATQWAKALSLYKIRNGSLPNFSGCLGYNYRYNYTNDTTVGPGQCQQSNSTTGVTSATLGPGGKTLTAVLTPFTTSQPTPAFVTAGASATSWERGIYYYNDTGSPVNAYIDIVLDGTVALAACPSINGLSATGANTPAGMGSTNTICTYKIGVVATYE